MAAQAPLNGHRELTSIGRITNVCYFQHVLLFRISFVILHHHIFPNCTESTLYLCGNQNPLSRVLATVIQLVVLCARLIDKLYSVLALINCTLHSTENSAPQSSTFQPCGGLLRSSLQFNVSHQVEWIGTKAAL